MGFVITSTPHTRQAQFSLLAFVVFLVYGAILLVLVPKHEPWFDEAQAWLLARDASYPELLGRYLRYEGSPGLWHTVLSVPAKMGAPYGVLNYISAAIALMGTALLLFFSPFPILLRFTLPFTFFLLYQYAVVARSYSLFLPLLFLLALLYPQAETKILLFASVLVLLANVSLHGFLIALAIGGTYAWESRALWASNDRTKRLKHVVAFAGLALASILITIQLKPPTDITGFTGLNFGLRHLIVVSILKTSDALTGNIALSTVVFVITFWWFWRTHTALLFSSGLAMLSCIAGIVYSHVWHEGLVFVFWLFVLWVSFDRSRQMSLRVPAVVTGVLILVLGVQLYWSFRTVRFDFDNPYSGSKQLAQFLRQSHLDQSRIFAFGFKSISILPYYPSNIFDNYHHGGAPSFWLWSKENTMNQDIAKVSVSHPRSIIISVRSDDDPSLVGLRNKLTEDGYYRLRRFKGSIYWKDRVLEDDSYELWESVAATAGNAAVQH